MEPEPILYAPNDIPADTAYLDAWEADWRDPRCAIQYAARLAMQRDLCQQYGQSMPIEPRQAPTLYDEEDPDADA